MDDKKTPLHQPYSHPIKVIVASSVIPSLVMVLVIVVVTKVRVSVSKLVVDVKSVNVCVMVVTMGGDAVGAVVYMISGGEKLQDVHIYTCIYELMKTRRKGDNGEGGRERRKSYKQPNKHSPACN